MKIIAAVDESRHSDFVTELLTRLPLPEPSEIVLVNVVENLSGYAYGARVRTLLAETFQHQHEEAAKNLLRRMHARLEPSVSVVRQELMHGHVADRITALAESEKANLVVLGARGVNALERFLLGSTSEKVIAYAGCSVLVGHHSETETVPVAEATSKPLRILVACDGSKHSEAGLDQIASLRLRDQAEVQLVTVQTLVTSFRMDVMQQMSNEWQEERKHASELLEVAAERLRSSGVLNVRTRVQEGTNIAEELLRIADHDQVDLIVIGASGKSSVDRFLLGSVSKRLVRHAPCSVWVARD
jgi:nucleotide-binding universal stress UspA family protein